MTELIQPAGNANTGEEKEIIEKAMWPQKNNLKKQDDSPAKRGYIFDRLHFNPVVQT